MNYKLLLIVVFALLAGMCFTVFDTAVAQGIIIITNKGVPESSLDKDSIKKIYSGNMTKWSNNETIIVTVVEGADYHNSFLKEYVRKSSSQFKKTWKKMVFTGKGSYPKKFDDEESLIDYVSKTEGAIGYVTTDAATDKVKVISN